jgi:hypothetical protein
MQKAESLVTAINGILQAYKAYLPQEKPITEITASVSKSIQPSASANLPKGNIKQTVENFGRAHKETGIGYAELIAIVKKQLPQAKEKSIGATISYLKNLYEKRDGKLFWKA